MAVVYEAQSDFNNALVCYKDSLPIKERLGGKNDPDYASTLSNIAVVYKNKGEYELALNKYEEAIRIEK